jgi:hypothetical protein
VRDELSRLLRVPEDREIVALVAMGYAVNVQPRSPIHRTDVAEYLD